MTPAVLLATCHHSCISPLPMCVMSSSCSPHPPPPSSLPQAPSSSDSSLVQCHLARAICQNSFVQILFHAPAMDLHTIAARLDSIEVRLRQLEESLSAPAASGAALQPQPLQQQVPQPQFTDHSRSRSSTSDQQLQQQPVDPAPPPQQQHNHKEKGCAKCRWRPKGCGQCRQWAEEGLHGYYFQDDEVIAGG